MSPKGGRTAAPPRGAAGDVAAALTAQETRSLQVRLCMGGRDVDGTWGPRTQAALALDRDFRKARGDRAAPLTSEEKTAYLGLTDAAAAGRCARR